MRLLALWLVAACTSSPGTGTSGDGGPPRGDASPNGAGDAGGPADVPWFDPSVTRIVIELDHATGQAPYTGALVGGGDTFDLGTANLARVFGPERELVLPRTVAGMEDIGVVSDAEITSADILALAAAHRDQADDATTETYWVVFLGGQFTDATGPQPNVLGVSLGNGTNVIAMFKDVIRSTNSVVQPNASRYVEQTTLIHEIGHAIGLVDNGIAAVTTHRDPTHGPHCDDSDCVMYWLNEGASEATSFALRRVLTSDQIVFDAACLADIDQARGATP